MDTNTLIAVLVPSCLSVCLAGVNLWLSYRKDKKRKHDLAWDTATKNLIALETLQPQPLSNPEDAETRLRYMEALYQGLKCIIDEEPDKLERLLKDLAERLRNE